MLKLKKLKYEKEFGYLIVADQDEKLYVIIRNIAKSDKDKYVLFKCTFIGSFNLDKLGDEVHEPWVLVEGVSNSPFYSGLCGKMEEMNQDKKA